MMENDAVLFLMADFRAIKIKINMKVSFGMVECVEKK